MKFQYCQLYDGAPKWYHDIKISKVRGMLLIECNKGETITVGAEDESCKHLIADSNFAWVRFADFRRAWYESHVRGKNGNIL